MALSILEYAGTENGKLVLIGNIGTNQNFEIKIGQSNDISREGGLSRVLNDDYRSGLLFLPKEQKSKFRISIPLRSLPFKQNFIQMISFKNRNGVGIAWSEIIEFNKSENEYEKAIRAETIA